MTFKVFLSDNAENDLDEAFIWYETQNEGLGKEFIYYINEGFDYIRRRPNSSSDIFEGILRRHIISKFPFSIYYFFNEPILQIQVIAILHFKRGEAVWKNRLQ